MKPTEEYIISQPDTYRSILLHLISAIEQTIPNTELLFKYGIPYFYYKKKPFCYLAVNHKKQFVDLGLARGFQLIKNQEFLIDEKRNTVKSLRYLNLEDIDNTILKEVLYELAGLYV